MRHFNRRNLLKSGAAIAAIAPLAACSGGAGDNTASDSLEAPTPPADTPPATGYTAAALPDGQTQLQMLAAGETTSLALTEAAIARSKAAQPLINAVASETYDAALEAAANPPAGAWRTANFHQGSARLERRTDLVRLSRVPRLSGRGCAHYPVYDRDYATHFEKLDAWAGSLDNLLTFGRQGLFAHDNTHHALAMAYGAVNALNEDGTLDRAHWAELREEFETHVVED